MTTSRAVRSSLSGLLRPQCIHYNVPIFLLPSECHQEACFSTTCAKYYPRDMNRERGVSTARRTGLRQPVSVSKTPLPKPVLDAAQRSKIKVDDDHPLWAFFHSKDKPANTPEEDHAHGRHWTVEELRGRSWEDLHALWWVCCKERNIIATEAHERDRLEAGYGKNESKVRDKTVRWTMRGIKQVLTERYYSWQEAEQLAKADPEIDFSGNGPLYSPVDFVEDEETLDRTSEKLGSELEDDLEDALKGLKLEEGDASSRSKPDADALPLKPVVSPEQRSAPSV